MTDHDIDILKAKRAVYVEILTEFCTQHLSSEAQQKIQAKIDYLNTLINDILHS